MKEGDEGDENDAGVRWKEGEIDGLSCGPNTPGLEGGGVGEQ